MSIIEHIQDLQSGKTPQLLRIDPPKGSVSKRGVFLGPVAQRDMDGVGLLLGRGNVYGVLERWVIGQLITVRLRGRKSVGFLARLDPPPDDVWELRVTQPTPQGRLFGRFAARDVFVVTHMHTRNHLKDPGSPEWNAATKQCVDEWERLFPNMPPHSGNGIGDYISENWTDANA